MLNKTLQKLKNSFNLEYVLGLCTCIIIPLLIMSLYWDKSISNYDGWYNLYAQDILNGRVPYMDFHFLMPPVFLYAWTIIQKIFGDYIIVFHLTSIVCKCILSGVLYHTFTRFFNIKISTISALFSSIIMLIAMFDNCTFSYNEFVTVLCLILINLFISFTKKLYDQDKISYIYIAFMSIVCTVLFFTKQTHGIVIPFGFLIIFSAIALNKMDKLSYFKSIGVGILSFITTSFLVFLPILKQNILYSYISNVYLGTSAKGSISDIVELPLRMISEYKYMWPIFIILLCGFILLIFKKYSLINMYSMEKMDKSKFIPPVSIILFCSILTIICAFYLNQYLASNMVLLSVRTGVQTAVDQIGAIAQYAIFFMSVFYFIRFFISKKEHDAKKMILYCIFTLTFLSIAFSSAGPYFSYFLYGLALASLLNYKFKQQAIFEILSFILLLTFIFLITWIKIILPFSFHGFSSSNIAVERKISKLSSLKGFKLSTQEINTYEDIDDTLNKYLDKNDKIFCFINNTIFYNLLNRQPFYSDYYNLYWDVSPDKDAEIIYNNLNMLEINKLPKAIVYFENPEWNILVHENLFRSGDSNNFQRKIDMLLKTYIHSKRYIVVEDYNAENYYKENVKFSKIEKKLIIKNKELRELLRTYDYNKNFDVNKYNKIEKIKKELKVLNKEMDNISNDTDRYFLEDDFKLKILIRNDIYNKKGE